MRRDPAYDLRYARPMNFYGNFQGNGVGTKVTGILLWLVSC